MAMHPADLVGHMYRVLGTESSRREHYRQVPAYFRLTIKKVES